MTPVDCRVLAAKYQQAPRNLRALVHLGYLSVIKARPFVLDADQVEQVMAQMTPALRKQIRDWINGDRIKAKKRTSVTANPAVPGTRPGRKPGTGLMFQGRGGSRTIPELVGNGPWENL